MSASSSNAALDTILADYQRYHLVLVIVSSLLLMCLAVLMVICWRQFRSTRRAVTGASRRQTVTYLAFIILGMIVALFLALIAFANLTTVLDTARGFADVGLHSQAFTDWVASGSASIPPEVQRLVDARLSWQRPKAIIVTLMLIATIPMSLWIWRRWVNRTFASRLANASLLLAGSGLAVVSLLLMLMVMGNTQAAIAPVAMTLIFG